MREILLPFPLSVTSSCPPPYPSFTATEDNVLQELVSSAFDCATVSLEYQTW